MWLLIIGIVIIILITIYLANRYFIFKHESCTFTGFCEEQKYVDLKMKTMLSDKIKAKQWINKHFGHILNTAKTLYILNKADDLLKVKLPPKFLIKLNTGSSFNYIYNETKKLTTAAVNKIVNKIRPWLQICYTYNMPFGFKEPQYEHHNPTLFVEEYLGDNPHEMNVFVIKGKVAYIQNLGKKRYLLNSQLQPIKQHYLMHSPPSEEQRHSILHYNLKRNNINKSDLILKFEKLAKEIYEMTNINLFRLDVYLIRNRIYFGELTFTPSACRLKFSHNFDKDLYTKFIK